MEHLRTGMGIIDLVNNYLIVALNFGLVGLSIFLMFIVSIIFGIYRTMLRNRDDQNWRLGTSLLATIFCILVTIATVSPIFHVSILYWTTAAMGVAFARVGLYERLNATRPIPQ
jgi:O-antigen ligase